MTRSEYMKAYVGEAQKPPRERREATRTDSGEAERLRGEIDELKRKVARMEKDFSDEIERINNTLNTRGTGA